MLTETEDSYRQRNATSNEDLPRCDELGDQTGPGVVGGEAGRPLLGDADALQVGGRVVEHGKDLGQLCGGGARNHQAHRGGCGPMAGARR